MIVKKHRKKQTGNALIEFAMVFPLLAVFTMGSIYLSISFGQKAMMNGLAFYEARSASVRKADADIDTMVKARYKLDSGGKQPWLDKVKSNISIKDGMLEVTITKDPVKMDMLYNSLALLGGNKPTSIKEIKSYMDLPYEYVEHNQNGSISDRSQTYSVVDYKAEYTFEKFIKESIASFPTSIQSWVNDTIFKKMVDQKQDSNMNDMKKSDDVLGTNQSANMKVLQSSFSDWSMDYKDVTNGGINSATNELPVDLTIDDPNKFLSSMNFLRTTGENVGKIETGKVALVLIKASLINVTPAGQALSQVMKVVGTAAEKVQPVLSDVSGTVSKGNRLLFRETVIPR